MTATGIQPPLPPGPGASYAEGVAWHASLAVHPSHTRRIRWPCAKCGKVFEEHCGLDVLAKHGRIAPNGPPKVARCYGR